MAETFETMLSADRDFAAGLKRKLMSKLPSSLDKAAGLDFIPYTVKNNAWQPGPFDGICWWTNGFWPGEMWLMYRMTGEERYRREAERAEAMLDGAFNEFWHLHHDLGFMWRISSGVSWQLTGNRQSLKRAMLAANLLAGRYNPNGFIRAWNEDRTGWAIIDCMMNLNLLYWATEESGDPRFRMIAMNHADTAMRYFIRPDGSANHIVVFDPETMAVKDIPAGQGYAPGSSWSRGQSWALYGFTLSWMHTGKAEYLDTARRSADYFLTHLGEDGLPDCDFCQPAGVELKDCCAGAVAACGLLRLAKAAGDRRYYDGALRLLHALDEHSADWSPDDPAVLTKCTGSYHSATDHNIAMVYADYFFVEAVLQLNGDSFCPW